MRKFEIGNTYKMRSICNHDCIWTYTVINRTDCTVTLADEQGKTSKHRISKRASAWNNAETVFPLGQYSMCPSLVA